MRGLILWLAAAAGVAVLSLPASAGGIVEAAELEHARANARAGGPVSEQDAELLQRWGCSSGTQNPVCGSGYRSGYRYYRHRPHHRRHRH
jgi:hypothetical protein